MAVLQLLLPALALLVAGARADTPANCTYQDVAGTWILYESERSQSSGLDCGQSKHAAVQKVTVELKFPSLAVDQWGNKGVWTMVYNQGFEVTVAGRSYFAYSDFAQQGEEVTSYCSRTLPGHGWSHDVTVRNWACFKAKKIEKVAAAPKVHQTGAAELSMLGRQAYHQSEELAADINRAQAGWVAGTYPHLEGRTRAEVLRMRGGPASRLHARPVALASPATGAGFLPAAWDWRDVQGQDYVSPVRNQGACGSCYAFSSMGMLEARVRVATGNTKQFTFSPQDVVSCSGLAQGCEGGFPFLVAGRYGKDYGVVEEACSPYQGNDTACATRPCLRHYTASYRYVGGYYGGCSEEAMKQALLEGGPLSVSFEVYDDFMQYKSGVYSHTGLRAGSFQPLELTNHAVLLVGYGTEPSSGLPYWTVKNSWGPAWGEGGYFRIRRGTDECAIESLAVEATVIP